MLVFGGRWAWGPSQDGLKTSLGNPFMGHFPGPGSPEDLCGLSWEAGMCRWHVHQQQCLLLSAWRVVSSPGNQGTCLVLNSVTEAWGHDTEGPLSLCSPSVPGLPG